jgi:hypothetical protein
MQEGLLFHHLHDVDSDYYFQQTVYTIHAEINEENFRCAWGKMIERHEILRTAFSWENISKPIQLVLRTATLSIQYLDWRGSDASDQKSLLNSYMVADRREPFDFSKPPLMRIALLRVADSTYWMLWSWHHILMDGWSSVLLMKEVAAHYNVFQNSTELVLPPPCPFRSYVQWLHQQDAKGGAAYWKQYLHGLICPTPLPLDRWHVDKDPTNGSGQRSTERKKMSAEWTRSLRDFAQARHVTVNTLIQAAWALMISQYTGEADILFGITVAGRPTALSQAESMIGLFINTIPIRISVRPRETVVAWLRQMQLDQIAAQQYAYTALVKIQGESAVPSQLPLFESIVVFENYPEEIFEDTYSGATSHLRNTFAVGEIRHFENTNYPLGLAASMGRELWLKLGYDVTRFSARACQMILDRVVSIIEAMMASPDAKIEDLHCLTEAEYNRLVFDWNSTTSEDASWRSAHNCFEQQAALIPDAVAVVFEDAHISYRELNSRANQLAHYLSALGLGPEKRVAVYLRRSPEMIIAILGTLKSGASYVPVDPAYTRKRIRWMLADISA